MTTKPQSADGYHPEETRIVVSTILTVMSALGGLSDLVCVVGGMTPKLLIDVDAGTPSEGGHCGSNDFDLGFSMAMLDGSRYAEAADRLRELGFKPASTDKGEIRRQRWNHPGFGIDIDFLIGTDDEDEGGELQDLESDFAAVKIPALEMAFSELAKVPLSGKTLDDAHVERDVNVCGPGAFVVLKALAFADRTEGKDAYDLHYLLSNFEGGISAIAAAIAKHRNKYPEIVNSALDLLARDFATIDHIGPKRCADFSSEDSDAVRADVHGEVQSLLAELSNESTQS